MNGVVNVLLMKAIFYLEDAVIYAFVLNAFQTIIYKRNILSAQYVK